MPTLPASVVQATDGSTSDAEAYSQLGPSPSSCADEELAHTKQLLDRIDRPQYLRKVTGSMMQMQMVERWSVSGAKRKLGRKSNQEFRREVLDQLVFTTLERVDGEDRAVVVANVCYSHAMMIQAATTVKQQPR